MRPTARASRILAATAGFAAIALTAACGSTSSASAGVETTETVTSSASSSPPSITACTTANLTLTLGTPDGAAGHLYLPLTFANSGTTACMVNGYPGVSLVVSAAGAQIGNPAARTNTGTAATLTLQPGAKAATTIDLTQAGNYDPTTCTPTAAAGFRVFPPNETNAAFVSYPATGCMGTTVTLLTVTPLVAAP